MHFIYSSGNEAACSLTMIIEVIRIQFDTHICISALSHILSRFSFATHSKLYKYKLFQIDYRFVSNTFDDIVESQISSELENKKQIVVLLYFFSFLVLKPPRSRFFCNQNNTKQWSYGTQSNVTIICICIDCKQCDCSILGQLMFIFLYNFRFVLVTLFVLPFYSFFIATQAYRIQKIVLIKINIDHFTQRKE